MESQTSALQDQVSPPHFAAHIRLSPWVNQRLPDWEDLLTAHDVARLTRRRRWVISALTLMRRFPRRIRYRGHRVGWLKSDIVNWLAEDTCSRDEYLARAFVHRSIPQQPPCLNRVSPSHAKTDRGRHAKNVKPTNVNSSRSEVRQ
jgi:predicted DNA-binding transcriptional regulator AlpA